MPNIFQFLDDLIDGSTPPAPPSIKDLTYNLSNIRLDNFPTINTNSNFAITQLPDIQTHVRASVDKLVPIDFNVAIKELPELSARIGASLALDKLPDININGAIKSLPKVIIDAGLNDLRVKELAPINLQFSLKPARLKLPFGYSFKVGIFGLEIFSVQMKGEVKAELEDL